MAWFSRKDNLERPLGWTPSSDQEFVRKYTENEMIEYGKQLVVREGQEAFFMKGGVYCDPIPPGTITLTSGNMPGFLERFFGDSGQYAAEVWFISTTAKRNLKWGTPQRIPVRFGPNYQVRIGAFGQWGFRISDSRSFMTQIIGAQVAADSGKILEYFIGELIQRFSTALGRVLIEQQISVLDISIKLNDISAAVMAEACEEFTRFGIELLNFTIASVNLDPEDLKKIQQLSEQAFEMSQLNNVQPGAGYLAAKQLDIMREAAQNPGMAGAMSGMGMGMGLGMGFAAAGQYAGQVMQPPPQPQAAPQPAAPAAPAIPADEDPVARLARLKQLLEAGILTQEEYAAKRQAIIEKL